jgi:hypothetical protein
MLCDTDDRVFAFMQSYPQRPQQSPSFPEMAAGCAMHGITANDCRKWVISPMRREGRTLFAS